MSNDIPAGVRKLATGIAGLDSLLGGGLPDGRMTLVMGDAGAGKSVLCMQLLKQAAERQQPGLIVGFEETAREMVENLASFNWDLAPHVGSTLHLMEAEVGDEYFQADDFEISGLLAAVEAKVSQTGARWVVFDGIDALLRALGDRSTALRELLRLRRWVSGLEVAAIVTAKERESAGEETEEFGLMPFMADCVVRLRHTVREQVFVRKLRVLKYRGGPGTGAEAPFVIDDDGISVAYRESRRLDHEVFTERVSTGIDRLDTLVGGGYIRGSSILVSGAPGTAKTTLGGALASAACKRGEPVLLISFDESGVQIIRNMRSVGIELEPHVASGHLHLDGFRASAVSAEDHLLEIQRLIRNFRPRFLVMDPVSALAKAGGRQMAADVTERLLDLAKSLGITVLMTSLLEDLEPEHEGTDSHVSTIADTWIALSYNVRGGERNRALTVVKARGTEHSNQVRELRLGAAGPTLVDVYTAGGDVAHGNRPDPAGGP